MCNLRNDRSAVIKSVDKESVLVVYDKSDYLKGGRE